MFLTHGALWARTTVGMGLFNSSGTTQKDPSGGTNRTSFSPSFYATSSFKFLGNHFIAPMGGFVWHRDAGEDEYGDHSKKTYFVAANLIRPFLGRFAFHYGYGMFMTKISGDGGAVTVRNGDGYGEAYRPEESVTSYNSTLNAGVEYLPKNNVSIRGDLFLFSPLSSDKRSPAYQFSVGFML